MIPGEYRTRQEPIVINEGRKKTELLIINTGDRPVQVGSHYHFFEVNKKLEFDRAKSYGMRLNIPAGTAVRFEPGEQKPIKLVSFGGNKHIYGLNNLTAGPLVANPDPLALNKKVEKWKGDS